MTNDGSKKETDKKDIDTSFKTLYDIISLLRSPEGCPWDRKQTPRSLRSSLIEEIYETIAAIDTNDTDNLCEELGDMLLLILLITRMNEEAGDFTVIDVLKRISQKLIRRHPHVFEHRRDTSIPEIMRNWDHIKEHVEGKKKPDGILAGVNDSLPPLEKALSIQKKAAKTGFDWKEVNQIFPKLAEEIGELQNALVQNRSEEVEEEIGDILFTVVNISRFLNIDPSPALEKTNRKFRRRFQEIEEKLRQTGTPIENASFEMLDALWEKAKENEKSG